MQQLQQKNSGIPWETLGRVLTAVLDARLEGPPRERRGAALDDARLQPHLQHVGLRRCGLVHAHAHVNGLTHTNDTYVNQYIISY